MTIEPQSMGSHLSIFDYDPDNAEHTKLITMPCALCGQPAQTEAFSAKFFHKVICDECSRKLNTAEEAERIASMTTPEKRFFRIAPKSFFEGDTRTCPDHKGFPRAALREALAWNPTGRGLFINGPTGSCKSRILFELLHHLIVEECRHVEVLQGGDFRQRMIEAYRDERSGRVIDRLSFAPILAWDDFGQDALKEGMETDLRAIIDYRYREGLPILITTQFSPELLTQRLSGGNAAREQVCASIIRRILERSRIITL